WDPSDGQKATRTSNSWCCATSCRAPKSGASRGSGAGRGNRARRPQPIMVAGGEHCQLRAAIEVLVPYTTRGATAKPTRSPRTTPALHNSSTTSAPGSPTNPPCHLSAHQAPPPGRAVAAASRRAGGPDLWTGRRVDQQPGLKDGASGWGSRRCRRDLTDRRSRPSLIPRRTCPSPELPCQARLGINEATCPGVLSTALRQGS